MNFLSASAPAPVFVPPTNERPLVYAFSFLDISACVGMLGLLVLGGCTKRARANPALLHFHFGFFLTSFGETMMVWTGNAFNLNPPPNLCLINSAFVSMSPTIKGGVAFALTCKVWAHTMTVVYPNSGFLRFMSSPWPIALTWLGALPLFFATIVTGLHDRSSVQRTSIFYCLSQSRTLSVANYAISALLEIMTLVLAGWTALIVTRVRRRLRSAVHSKSPVHYTLITRTLLFSVALTIALVITLVVALLNITAPISGMTIACLDFLGLLVFASDPVLLRSMARRVRGDEDTSFATGPSANNPQTTGVSIQISRSGPMRDEEWGSDKIGSHALSVMPTSTRNTPVSPVIIQKVDHVDEYSSWDELKQGEIKVDSFSDDKSR